MAQMPLSDQEVTQSLPCPEKSLFFEKERKHRMLQHMLWIGCTVFWCFSFYNFYDQNQFLGWLTFGYACLSTIWMVFAYLFTSRRFVVMSSRLFIIVLAGLLLFYVYLGGEGNGFALWSYPFPLVVFFMLGKREGLVVVTLFWIIECVMLLSPMQALLQAAYMGGFKFRFLLSLALLIIMTYIFETGRDRNQQKMHQQQCRLKTSEKRAREAMEQFKITQSQLVQSGKLASIGELAAGVAHELNQPLMVIRGNAQLINRQMGKPGFSPEDMVGFLSTIERNTKRMGFIINHLRSFSRQSPANLEPVDINKVIKNAFLLMGEQLRLRSIKVEQQMQEDLPMIMGEANQLEQVILNLLTNARDTICDSDGTRGRKSGNSHAIVIATRHLVKQNSVEITCKDTGSGIPAASLDSIFDPFFTTKAVGKGTGLGLSISYGIVQNHDGQIKVTQTGPGGTTLSVVLPALAAREKSKVQSTDPVHHN